MRDVGLYAVWLMGWAHASEATAMKEIMRQLSDAVGFMFQASASSAGANLTYLTVVLRQLAAAHATVVFVMEDFDRFAERSNKLLYTLLDALHTDGAARAVVLGTTGRGDCTNLMELRVRSRFSHRHEVLRLPRAAAPMPVPPGTHPTVAGMYEGAIDVLRCMLTLPAQAPLPAATIEAHTAAVDAALRHPRALPALQELVANDTSLHALRNVAQWALAWLPNDDTAVAAACARVTALSHQGMEAYIVGLAMPELIMLVAAARASWRRDETAITYAMAAKEFAQYCAPTGHVDRYSPRAAARAWGTLLGLGLVAVEPSKHQVALAVVTVTREELLAGVQRHELCPAALRDWAARPTADPLATATSFL
jgi:origin recognition complex subunit 4